MARRDRGFDLLTSQTKARAFVLDYLKTTTVGLPAGLDDDAFKVCMDAVARAMAAAYVKGYLDSAEGGK